MKLNEQIKILENLPHGLYVSDMIYIKRKDYTYIAAIFFDEIEIGNDGYSIILWIRKRGNLVCMINMETVKGMYEHEIKKIIVVEV